MPPVVAAVAARSHSVPSGPSQPSPGLKEEE